MASSDIPDWTDGEPYNSLLRAERAGFAWEWLRRQPSYRQAAVEVLARRPQGHRDHDREALRWNLHMFEDPSHPVPIARPLWAAPRHPWVVSARAVRSEADEDALILSVLEPFAKLVHSGGAQRLLLTDGYRTVRLDVTGVEAASSPVRLFYCLSGVRALYRPLIVLQRLRSLAATGRFVRSLYPPVSRARRLILLLRAYDALQAGASHADIAAALLTSSLNREGWRIHSPSLRSQAQRLAHKARRMAQGEFWDLLE